MNDVIARLAAANPLPTTTQPRPPEPLVLPTRRILLAVAMTAAVAVPAAAFAGRLADFLGLSNQGTAVATDSLSLMRATKLADAVQELGVPTTMHQLTTRGGISFYVARRADGDYCFAIESAAAKGVGCDLTGTFPSPQRPVVVFPPFRQFAGFAADGVVAVHGLDAAGAEVASAPVVDNVFAAPDQSTGAIVSLAASDAAGHVVWTWRLPGR
jgi:hypothetical protein